jgi:hypothetical protein
MRTTDVMRTFTPENNQDEALQIDMPVPSLNIVP